jgi:drug/metabolite transporter (DMT)-like permease
MWLFYAILAAILWGFNYALAEKILHSISTATLLAMEMLVGGVLFSIIAYFTTMKKDLNVLITEPRVFWLTMLEIGVVIFASYFIVSSIRFKNATVAGIIELIYPLFTILFTWYLFHESHVNLPVIIGGSLIFIGVIVISLS